MISSFFKLSFLPFSILVVAVGFGIVATAHAGSILGETSKYGLIGGVDGGPTTINGAGTIAGDLGLGGARTGYAYTVVGTQRELSPEDIRDFWRAFNGLDTMQADATYVAGQDMGSPAASLQNIPPGNYKFSSTASLTGNLILDAQGQPDGVWVFNIGTTFTVAAAATVTFINVPEGVTAADNYGVYWRIGTAATFGAGVNFVGNLLAGTVITTGDGCSVKGRLMGNAITAPNNDIDFFAVDSGYDAGLMFVDASGSQMAESGETVLLPTAPDSGRQGILGETSKYGFIGGVDGGATTINGAGTIAGDLGLGGARTGYAYTVDGTQRELSPEDKRDFWRAFNGLDTMQADATYVAGQDMGSPAASLQNIPSGNYKFLSTASLTGNLILDAQGQPDGVWVFNIGTTFTVAAAATVTFINVPEGVTAAENYGVYWRIGTAATFGAGVNFVGNLLAGTAITTGDGCSVKGRLMGNVITAPNNNIDFVAVDSGYNAGLMFVDANSSQLAESSMRDDSSSSGGGGDGGEAVVLPPAPSSGGDSDGTVVAPPAPNYFTWATGSFLGELSESAANVDFDGGGLGSGIEWVVGGDPTDGNDDSSVTPTLDTSDPSNLVFTYLRRDEAEADGNTAITVEYSSDLISWTPLSHVVDGFTIDDSFVPAEGFRTVKVSIPKTLESRAVVFVRLSVSITMP